mmetsp:Transcript_19170/g.19303  ORF Transcript_19170/g.19303 Transcript_19170/m.19303 type:complete len:444 (-) Transcript_19170:117-1448(-)
MREDQLKAIIDELQSHKEKSSNEKGVDSSVYEELKEKLVCSQSVEQNLQVELERVQHVITQQKVDMDASSFELEQLREELRAIHLQNETQQKMKRSLSDVKDAVMLNEYHHEHGFSSPNNASSPSPKALEDEEEKEIILATIPMSPVIPALTPEPEVSAPKDVPADEEDHIPSNFIEDVAPAVSSKEYEPEPSKPDPEPSKPEPEPSKPEPEPELSKPTTIRTPVEEAVTDESTPEVVEEHKPVEIAVIETPKEEGQPEATDSKEQAVIESEPKPSTDADAPTPTANDLVSAVMVNDGTLPCDWMELKDHDDNTYYYNHITGESTYHNPHTLHATEEQQEGPPRRPSQMLPVQGSSEVVEPGEIVDTSADVHGDWTRYYDDSQGRYYWYNATTEESYWDEEANYTPAAHSTGHDPNDQLVQHTGSHDSTSFAVSAGDYSISVD